MLPGLLEQLPSLGIAGLLFVMWWAERQERTRSALGHRDIAHYAAQLADANRNLLDVLRANTAALTSLREELRAQHDGQTAWLARLAAQLEQLGYQ